MITEVQYSKHIGLLFNHIIKLGYQLGLSEADVLAAYDDKNKVNHARQVRGY